MGWVGLQLPSPLLSDSLSLFLSFSFSLFISLSPSECSRRRLRRRYSSSISRSTLSVQGEESVGDRARLSPAWSEACASSQSEWKANLKNAKTLIEKQKANSMVLLYDSMQLAHKVDSFASLSFRRVVRFFRGRSVSCWSCVRSPAPNRQFHGRTRRRGRQIWGHCAKPFRTG